MKHEVRKVPRQMDRCVSPEPMNSAIFFTDVETECQNDICLPEATIPETRIYAVREVAGEGFLAAAKNMSAHGRARQMTKDVLLHNRDGSRAALLIFLSFLSKLNPYLAFVVGQLLEETSEYRFAEAKRRTRRRHFTRPF